MEIPGLCRLAGDGFSGLKSSQHLIIHIMCIAVCAAMKQDLTGRTFGYLTVVKRAEKGDSRHRYWVCNCICGNEKIVEESHLKNGHTKSCGCYRKEVRQGKGNDLRGMRFGRLTAVCLISAPG